MQRTLKGEAQDYEPIKTKNIADLDKVSINLEVEEREGTDKKGKRFSYNVVIVDGEEYRVPNSVLKSLKAILEEKPDLIYFKVKKIGEGFDSEYTVITLE
jgi:hypothetical protein